jgi:hypothetical protein
MEIQRVVTFDDFTKNGFLLAIAKSSMNSRKKRCRPIDPGDADALAIVAIRRAKKNSLKGYFRLESLRVVSAKEPPVKI